MPEFGDILKWRDGSEFRFMFLCKSEVPDGLSIRVLVLAAPQGDLWAWVPGETIIYAGINELVPDDA